MTNDPGMKKTVEIQLSLDAELLEKIRQRAGAEGTDTRSWIGRELGNAAEGPDLKKKILQELTGNLADSIDAVMSLKDKLPGIYGTVSQLGCVSEPEYEKALVIAAGERMQNIVVEDEDVAEKCIDYLKKERIGRAMFLPLNKINPRVSGEAPSGSIGFARDYITTPLKFWKIFEYVYGDTILVKDIAAGKKVGIGKWRMITVDGDLITREGAMIGGYVNVTGVKSNR